MAKFRPVRPKQKRAAPQGALGCVILIILAIIGVGFFMYLVIGNANR